MHIYPVRDRQSIIVPSSTTHAHASWIEINSAAFEHNITQYKAIIGSALFAPVIKSNAYGHGIEGIARLCDASSAVDRLCTVSMSEALLLRSVRIQKPILVLSILDAPLEEAVMHSITLTIYDLETAQALNNIGKKLQTTIPVHIKIDTGLSRLGILAAEAVDFVQTICKLPYIFIEGIFTHFANSEQEDPTFARHQLTQFTQVHEMLKKNGIIIPLTHTTCSAAATTIQQARLTLVRAGIGIYGLWPSQANKEVTTQKYPQFTLKPILSWKTRIIQIKEIPAGSVVGYDCTFTTTASTTIATLPVGYWDGIDRRLSNNGCVVINEKPCPIIGRIAMNLMMIDCTNSHARVGDEVTIIGNHPSVTADAVAQRCNTINYEIVTRINPLLPRIFL